MSLAAVLLALAVLLTGGRTRAGVRVVRTDAPAPPAEDPLAVASSLGVFAACLSSGMAVAAAARASAPHSPRPLADVLERAADLLALGGDPASAWSTAAGTGDEHVDALCRLARRSATSGVALAQAVSELADQSRLDAADAARASAERASVLIAGPLGVCHLPAFVCLGVVPVVVGLAGDVVRSGVW
ncbi:type II secretion system protein F [Mycolicibacterium madagascariense]|uniref:Type II secretion system protein F n=1 Tax=Mycolicibacterium madagascariense TaxID=212765 RepID=A0A7I7XNS5_9MYCO|nr:type II secretion system F family protein [Mycolicibacterium madagascariense]MCV7014321.1 type II secretion system F family protein [Mycolicibacterium madagascariense]BBZ30652.1 type II secretion system protein F [Mycolicibacterium madagascariense]